MELGELADQAESVSAAYAARNGFARDGDWFMVKLQEEIGEVAQAYLRRAGRGRSQGASAAELDAAFGDEVADALCHLLLLARHEGVDVAGHVTAKWLSRLPGAPEVTDA
ncbi:pyrophosphatase [Actinokineospora inagensis]|uniref:pyrophosphatase n=1 Tax=Actinokineospora inagensis TaxID=103730 RepID=UPI00041B4D43|nr:pyrophosphatase [Actinokineospora inagensis]